MKLMCDCENVEMGSYDNTVLLGFYPCMREYRKNRLKADLSDYGITVDKCIANEIINLWENGIRTLGSCCGHNKVKGMINVHPKDFSKAISMGYEKYVFENNPERNDTVHTKRS